MLHSEIFYQNLKKEKNLGDSFKNWFNFIAEDGFNDFETRWYYGTELLGDPTLKPNIPNDFPIAQINLTNYEEFNSLNEIKGTAKKGLKFYSTFENFNLQLGQGINPEKWIEEGISVNNENKEIENNILGKINNPKNLSGFYTFKLTSYSSDEMANSFTTGKVISQPKGKKTEHEVVVKINENLERPQSKIVNNNSFDASGILTMKLQKKIGNEWIDEKIVVKKNILIPTKSLIKLDLEENYGWNLQNVHLNSKGDYRIYVSFETKCKIFENFWNFVVKED